jgi:signal transduction histidine kinase
VPGSAEPAMANRRLTPPTATGAAPTLRAPRILLLAAVRSSNLLGHDLIHRYRAERFELFLTAHFIAWAGFAILLPLWEYFWLLRSAWLLVFVGTGVGQCVVLAVALRLARLGRYQQSITLVCFGTWISAVLVTVVSPPLLPWMILVAMVPVVFAEPYIPWQRGLVFTVITATVVLAMVVLARFLPASDLVRTGPQWLVTLVLVAALPFNTLHVLVIAWNNAAALRTSEGQLAERAEELAASRTRLITAADEERRRLERDLHDGAQQHLVALSVLLQLARKADGERAQSLLGEASELLTTAIGEIRRLAHGIYPPLLVSGGLREALPALASHAPLPVDLDLRGLDRYPAAIEAAFYYCCSEALQNAAKHGGPDTTVTVAAQADERRLTLTVSDTGNGFDAGVRGTGLTNMTDRLSAIDGRLLIDTAVGRGTRVTATVVHTPPPTVLHTR